VRLRKPATREVDVLSAKTHVQECRLVIVMAGVTPKVVHLLTLEFVLDPLPIRRVPNQRKDGSDPLDQHGSLRSISIVECGLRSPISVSRLVTVCDPYLNTIIPVRISQQLLEPRSV